MNILQIKDTVNHHVIIFTKSEHSVRDLKNEVYCQH